MQRNNTNDVRSTPRKPLLGQVIACGVALSIMGFGTWSLLGLSAPYHPDSFEAPASRASSDLTSVGESN